MTTDKDIQVLEEMREEEEAKRQPYRHMPGSLAAVLWENPTRRITALSNILSELRRKTEALEHYANPASWGCSNCADPSLDYRCGKNTHDFDLWEGDGHGYEIAQAALKPVD